MLDDQTAKNSETEAKELMTVCEQTVHNGAIRLWIGETDKSLPTVRVQSVMSADRKFVTLIFNATGGGAGRDLEKLAISVPSGSTAAVPLNDQSTCWLVFKVDALRQELKPT